MTTLLRAACVYPIDRPLILNGAVAFNETQILSVGPYPDVRAAHPTATIEDLGDSLLLPGLINPHTHLELSSCNCDPPSASFTDWILSLRTRLGPTPDFAAATQTGIAQSLRFGVTTVGDISQQSHLTRPVLAQSPLRSVSYAETLGLARQRPRFQELLTRALAPLPSGTGDSPVSSFSLIPALSPHAPYTVDLPGYQQCLQLSRNRNLPLATHLAETPYEEPFLRHHAGPFRDLWELLGQWSDPVETFPGTPVEFAHAIGLLSHPTLLAHCNYVSDQDLSLLATGQASVIYCPRTHAYFNHPPHRFRDMLAAHINVALGTDSCASSPDLNLLNELRLVHHLHPDLPPTSLFPLITLSAARALQLHHQLGSLTPHKLPDFTAFPARTNNPVLHLLESRDLPAAVWIAGQKISP